MNTYDRADPDSDTVRAHPWTVATADPNHRYRDFRANPALIRSSLEDFLPWSTWPAIDTFYSLLEWLNGADSILESNDCAFEGPHTNSTLQFPKALEVTGRLMILWRELPLNLSRANTEWLKGGIHHYLTQIAPALDYGVVGTTVFHVKYVTLPLPDEQQFGFQLMLSFWSWGDTEEEVMGNLHRTIQNIWEALRTVVREAKESISSHRSPPDPHSGRRQTPPS
jgi:hypothetical protein